MLLACNSGELLDSLDGSLEVASARSTATSSTNSVIKSTPILLNDVKREVSEEVVQPDGIKERYDSLISKVNAEAHTHVTSSTSTNNTETKINTEESSNGSDSTNSKVSTHKTTIGMYLFKMIADMHIFQQN